MTPNPNSPAFIIHEVPQYACDSAQRIAEASYKIKQDAKNGRWNGITDDIKLEYNTYDGCIKVEAKLIDTNHHNHYFTIQFLPDNGFGDGTDYLYLKYLFEGEFDENVLSVRSFAEYLATYLEWESFEPELINCDRGILIPIHMNCVYEGFSKLLDITLAKLKPLEWFSSKEIQVNSYNDAKSHFSKVLSLLKKEAETGRWNGITSECISLKDYDDNNECSILLKYKVDEVWEWLIYINAVWYNSNVDLSCCMSCYPNYKLSNGIQQKLDAQFKEFLESLPSAKGHLWIGGGRGEHSLGIQFFHIEDSFDLFCNLLDEITAQIGRTKFYLSSPSIILTEEMETMKKQLEESLQTTLSLVTEEDEINKKLNNGYFVV